MKYIIAFIVCWALLFWLGGSRIDDGWDYIPAMYNWKGALISFFVTLAGFWIIYLVHTNS